MTATSRPGPLRQPRQRCDQLLDHDVRQCPTLFGAVRILGSVAVSAA